MVEAAAKRHCVDHKPPLFSEFEDDDLQEVAHSVGADGEDLGRVHVRFEVDPIECMVDCVAQVVFVNAMFES